MRPNTSEPDFVAIDLDGNHPDAGLQLDDRALKRRGQHPGGAENRGDRRTASSSGLKIRTRAVPPCSAGSTKVDSEKPTSFASACMTAESIARASVNTASWLPVSGVSVKTSTTT